MTGNRIARVVARPLLPGAAGDAARDQADVGAAGGRIDGGSEGSRADSPRFLSGRSRAGGRHRLRARAPTLDPKLDHIMPQVASMGAAVSVVDFDRDGWPDIYVTNSGEGCRNPLYRNHGDGTFEDVAGELGVADVNQAGTGVSMGAVWGDYDNDGFEDLLLNKWGRPELFHNEAAAASRASREQAGLAALGQREHRRLVRLRPRRAARPVPRRLLLGRHRPLAAHHDANHAGELRVREERRPEVLCSATSATAGSRKSARSWASTAGAGRWPRRPPTCAAPATRICSSPTTTASPSCSSTTGSGSARWARQTGVGYAPKSGMNVAFGDMFNQGRFAVYVSNISEEGILIQGNNLWVPKEGNDRRGPEVREPRARLGRRARRLELRRAVRRPEQRRHARPVPDQRLRLARPERSYWYDYSKVAGGNSTIIGDARNWPAFEGRSLSGYQPKRVWLNDGAGRFIDVAQVVGVTDTYDGRAVALADFWNRGVLDVVVANQSGPLLLYRNTVAPRKRLDRVRAGRNRQQPQRDRRAGHAVLERPAAGAGGVRRQRLLRAEPAPAALRPGQERAVSRRRSSAGHRASCRRVGPCRRRGQLHKIQGAAA